MTRAAEMAVSHESVAVEESPEENSPEEEALAKARVTNDAPARDVPPPEPETANGLVMRLRRQFMEGLPEGRGEPAQPSAGPVGPKASQEPQRSAIEEVRFRLKEFRTELLVRAAGRGKPSRQK